MSDWLGLVMLEASVDLTRSIVSCALESCGLASWANETELKNKAKKARSRSKIISS